MSDVPATAPGRDRPSFTPDERAGLHDFFGQFTEAADPIRADLLRALAEVPAFAELARAPPAVMAEQERAGLARLRRAIFDDDWRPYFEDLRASGRMYASLGVEFGTWLTLTSGYRRVLAPRIVATFAPDHQRQSRALLAMSRVIDIALGIVGDTYLDTKQQLIEQQQSALRELSTPVLAVRERLLLLPVIGVLDTRRARQLTEQLLQGVRAHRAQVVVMDITGVPAVDSKVASHLLQTVNAAQLMGAKVVLSGISPEVAQALVALGVELGDLVTVGDLRTAMETAEALIGGRASLHAGEHDP